MTTRRPSPGRPRHIPSSSAASPRDQVLDAAAELFVTRGFAATSTREIAERVGIRQASLYYHFAGKDEILAELLQRSVRPTVDKVAKIEALVPPETHATALYLLALIDIRTLADAPHNVGILYAQSDVTNSEVYAEFQHTRRELVDAYGRIGLRAASAEVAADIDASELGEMLMHSIEVVTDIRNAGTTMTPQRANRIADAVLRMCGVPGKVIAAAASAAYELLAEFHHETGCPLAESTI
ncbi:TetR/AcrR family transcriptional regulator [Nocardioides sp. KC13]|uniref:TetR/AcrR family transcriptional regulator n=1 Tax=Nocardioides turkmenicus TaxID=2711220 RepID=A0A6M1QV78_9ACTN|nr:TetR/AcrR family transcriptional regulator [Nocardioides sp. KC13]NGN91706.1 TetR/AcrR family transcriptional regulator [Nocardioides sp. KC13]